MVYKWKNGRFVIGFILDPFKKWIFPKGHLEGNESEKQAAVRETREEMGLRRIRVKAPLGLISFSFTRKPYRIHKDVHYFLMETRPYEKGKPQKEEKIQAIRWVGPKAAQEMLGYENTRVILDRAIAHLSKERERREERYQEKRDEHQH